MKTLIVLVLLSGCDAPEANKPAWRPESICSPDGISYWAWSGSHYNRFIAIRLDKDGKVIPCQP